MESQNQLLKVIQNQRISLINGSQKCPVCFMTFQDENQNRVRSNLRLPMKLFCGDTICQQCVKSSLKEESLECQVCSKTFKIKANSKGRVIFDNKWCRLKDQFGPLKVSSEQSILEVALRSIPLDHDVLSLQKSNFSNLPINEHQNSMMTQEQVRDLISPDIVKKPQINSDQVPVVSTKFHQKILKHKTSSG